MNVFFSASWVAGQLEEREIDVVQRGIGGRHQRGRDRRERGVEQREIGQEHRQHQHARTTNASAGHTSQPSRTSRGSPVLPPTTE